MKHFLTTDPVATILSIASIFPVILITVSFVGSGNHLSWSRRFDRWSFPMASFILITLAWAAFIGGYHFLSVFEGCASFFIVFSWVAIESSYHDTEM